MGTIENSGRDSNQTVCSACDHSSGWSHPNLGVNIPAGAACSVATSQATSMMNGRRFLIRCQKCNWNGSKPHPDSFESFWNSVREVSGNAWDDVQSIDRELRNIREYRT